MLRSFYLRDVCDKFDKKNAADQSAKEAKARIKITRKLRRINGCLMPSSTDVNPLVSAWWGRVHIFEAGTRILETVANCAKCKGRCRINLPTQCFEDDTCLQNVGMLEAVDVIRHGRCSYDNFVSVRKDWRIAPKNSPNCYTIDKRACEAMIKRLFEADFCLRVILHNEEKVRDLPPCGLMDELLFAEDASACSPPAEKKQRFECEWNFTDLLN